MELQGFETYLHQLFRFNTVKGIVKSVTCFIYWCQGEHLQAHTATYTDLVNYIAYCTAKGNSKHTMNQRLVAIKHFYNYLTAQNIRLENPAIELRIRNTQSKVPFNTLSYQELEELYKQYPANGMVGKRNKAILGLMIYQGLNTAELQALELKDIKLQDGTIYIPVTARSNDRVLNLQAHQIVQLQNYTLQVRPLLMAMHELITDKLFFSTGSSKQLSNSFTKMLVLIRKLNPSIKDQRQIRASVIAHWYKIYNTRQVQYMAGHRYVSSTERYRTNKLESLQEQLEKLHPIQ